MAPAKSVTPIQSTHVFQPSSEILPEAFAKSIVSAECKKVVDLWFTNGSPAIRCRLLSTLPPYVLEHCESFVQLSFLVEFSQFGIKVEPVLISVHVLLSAFEKMSLVLSIRTQPPLGPQWHIRPYERTSPIMAGPRNQRPIHRSSREPRQKNLLRMTTLPKVPMFVLPDDKIIAWLDSTTLLKGKAYFRENRFVRLELAFDNIGLPKYLVTVQRWEPLVREHNWAPTTSGSVGRTMWLLMLVVLAQLAKMVGTENQNQILFLVHFLIFC